MRFLQLRVSIYFVLITCLAIMHAGCFNCEKSYEKERKKVIAGRIVNKFTSSNHAEPILEIKNAQGKDIQGAYFQLLDLWNASQIGDSIYKAVNSLQYCLIKTDTIICFYPECHGVKMK